MVRRRCIGALTWINPVAARAPKLERMDLPLQITLRGIAHSDALVRLIRERGQKLQRFYPHLVSARVVVELAGRHQHQGKQFSVRLDLKVPGAEIAIDRQHHEQPQVAVRDAFDAARRKLEDELRLQRGDVKLHSR
jgi:ribosome-associated translation inhibitor RaiA